MSDEEPSGRGSRSRGAARSSGYDVRPAVATDAGGLAEVHVRVWRATYAGLMSAEYLAGLDPDAVTRRWHELLGAQDGSVRIYVGSDPDGRVVGFASGGPSRDEGAPAPQELYAINVLPSEQGTGLAQLLMEAVVGPGPCSLWVAVGNARAQAFYRRYGFVDDGQTMTDERSGVVEKRMVRASSEARSGADPRPE